MRVEKGECNRGDENDSFSKDDYIRLICDSQCPLKFREHQLAIAFGKKKEGGSGNPLLPIYTLFLTSSVVTVPDFLIMLENTFREFLSSKEVSFPFPPMNSFYRCIIHQLAGFYKLESVSFDQEPNQYVLVTRTTRSAVPAVLLSYLVKNHPLPMMPGTGNKVNPNKPGALLFSDLNESVKTEHLNQILSAYKGQYFLKWIDDQSAVALFNDEKNMKAAAYSTSSVPYIKVTPIYDSEVDISFEKSHLKDSFVGQLNTEITLEEAQFSNPKEMNDQKGPSELVNEEIINEESI